MVILRTGLGNKRVDGGAQKSPPSVFCGKKQNGNTRFRNEKKVCEKPEKSVDKRDFQCYINQAPRVRNLGSEPGRKNFEENEKSS